MKLLELKKKINQSTESELVSQLVDLRKSSLNLRLSLSAGSLEDLSSIRKNRKHVARLKTALSEKRTLSKKGL